jgi:hypothetical protein
MSKFKVGDKVVCIDASSAGPSGFLVEGGEYTIKSVYYGFPRLVEVTGSDRFWQEDRFKLREPVDNLKGEAKILIEKIGEIARIEVTGHLDRKQVENILNVVYGARPSVDFNKLFDDARKRINNEAQF